MCGRSCSLHPMYDSDNDDEDDSALDPVVWPLLQYCRACMHVPVVYLLCVGAFRTALSTGPHPKGLVRHWMGTSLGWVEGGMSQCLGHRQSCWDVKGLFCECTRGARALLSLLTDTFASRERETGPCGPSCDRCLRLTAYACLVSTAHRPMCPSALVP